MGRPKKNKTQSIDWIKFAALYINGEYATVRELSQEYQKEAGNPDWGSYPLYSQVTRRCTAENWVEKREAAANHREIQRIYGTNVMTLLKASQSVDLEAAKELTNQLMDQQLTLQRQLMQTHALSDVISQLIDKFQQSMPSLSFDRLAEMQPEEFVKTLFTLIQAQKTNIEMQSRLGGFDGPVSITSQTEEGGSKSLAEVVEELESDVDENDLVAEIVEELNGLTID